MSRHPELSVVIAVAHAEWPLQACLASARRAVSGMDAELILVSAGTGAADVATTQIDPDGPVERRIQGPPGSVVPELWAVGWREAHGERVGFTTAQFELPAGWGRRLVRELAAGYAGAGGPIQAPRNRDAFARAVFLLRYSAFLDTTFDGAVREIPGENAVYERTGLLANGATLPAFWEVEHHHILRCEGREVTAVREVPARFLGGDRPVTFVQHRFRHARWYGGFRVRSLGQKWWRVLLAAPIVPALLVARCVRRAHKLGDTELTPWLALPWLAVLATVWAAGEAVGALTAAVNPSPVNPRHAW